MASSKTWVGRVRLYRSGGCVASPDAGAFYGAVALISIPIGLMWAFPYFTRPAMLPEYFSTILRELLQERPNIFLWQSIILAAVALLMQTMLYTTLVLCRHLDPGIIPPRFDQPRAPTDPVPDANGAEEPDPVKQMESHTGATLQFKWCRSCQIWRPPRASHCSTCDVCVENFDHHCPWVGNCVGKRNYRFFVLFVWITCLNCCYCFGISLSNLILYGVGGAGNVLEAISKSPASAVLIFYSLLIALSLFGLGSYHLRILGQGLTTNEDIKRKYRRVRSPFSQGGFCQNTKRVLCGPFFPSALVANSRLPPAELSAYDDSVVTIDDTVGVDDPIESIKSALESEESDEDAPLDEELLLSAAAHSSQ